MSAYQLPSFPALIASHLIPQTAEGPSSDLLIFSSSFFSVFSLFPEHPGYNPIDPKFSYKNEAVALWTMTFFFEKVFLSQTLIFPPFELGQYFELKSRKLACHEKTRLRILSCNSNGTID